jgi:hypothetical protein
MKFIVATFREAAWAPLTVLCTSFVAAHFFDAYTRFPALDMPAHFCGGLAAAYFLWRALANAQSAGYAIKANPVIVVFAGTAVIAILWEVFFELLADHFFRYSMQHGMRDTLSDLFFGLAGGFTYLVVRRSFAARSDRARVGSGDKTA